MRTVVVLSGGLDSTVLAYWLHSQGHELRALSVNYGQRHDKELQAAGEVAAKLGIPWACADLRGLADIIGQHNSQTNPRVSVPDGHYTAKTMKATVVPNRNMIFLAVAIGHAIDHGFEAVAYGAHSGDHAIYADCRAAFANDMARVAKTCHDYPINLLRPFVEKTKADIVKLGDELVAPFALTWSCYKGGEKHCGVCGTCTERREAFILAGVQDPTVYA